MTITGTLVTPTGPPPLDRDGNPGPAATALRHLAARSPCRRLRVGALLVDIQDGTILGYGTNGPVPGEPPCTSCRREDLGIESGTRVEVGACVHAEWNAVLNAGRSTVRSRILLGSLDETGRLTDRAPCPVCARLLLAAGVHRAAEIVTDEGSRTVDLREIQYGPCG